MLRHAAIAALLAASVACTASPDRPAPDATAAASPDATAAAPRCDPPPVCPPLPDDTVDLAASPVWRRLQTLAASPAAAVDLAEVSALMSAARDPSVRVADVVASVDALAAEVRRATPARCVGRCRLRALVRQMFRVWRFRAEDDPNGLYNDPDRDLVDAVMANRVGYCEGLAVLFLALGRRLDLPLAGVLARQHIFVRYLGSDGAVDVDLTLGGRAPLPDTSLPGCRPQPGVYGVPLDAAQMVGPVVSVVGILDGLAGRRQWLDAAVALAPHDPDLRNNRGVERERAFDLAGALEDYRAAERLDPCVAFYRVNGAAALRRLGRLDEARAALDRLDADIARGAAEDDPLYASLARGDLALESGDDLQAERWYFRALTASGQAPIAQESLGSLYLLRGEWRAAGERFLAALEAGPRWGSRLLLAESLVELEDFDSARTELQRARREGVADDEVDATEALLAARQRRWPEAEAAARRCLEAAGGRCTTGLRVLGEAAAARGDLACASAYFTAFGRCPHAPRDRAWRQQVERVAALRGRVEAARSPFPQDGGSDRVRGHADAPELPRGPMGRGDGPQ